MDWHDEAAKGLPAPRDDEPTTLRQDILDELSDHFGCAFSRELTKNISTDEAAHNVRRRFGDPRAIARRLWFDAMRTQMMSQRLTLAMMVILACTSALATAFAWVAVRDGREANAALLEKLATMATARAEPSPEMAKLAESNAKTLATLGVLAAKMKPAESTESLLLSPVKVHLVRGHKGGPPAAGFRVFFAGAKTSTFPTFVETSDQNGNVDFGVAPYGEYRLAVTPPWKGEELTRTITLRPRARPTEPQPSKIMDEIVCPAEAPQETQVHFAIDWPTDLRNENLWVIARVESKGRKFDGVEWNTRRESRELTLGRNGEVLYWDGQVSEEPPGGRNHFVQPTNIESVKFFPTRHPLVSPKVAGRAMGNVPISTPTPPEDPLRWINQRYEVTDLAVVRAWDGIKSPTNPQDLRWTRRGLLILGWVRPFQENFYPPTFDEHGNRRAPPASFGLTMEAVAGHQNECRIPLPDAVLKQVRENLAKTKELGLAIPELADKGIEPGKELAIAANFLKDVGVNQWSDTLGGGVGVGIGVEPGGAISQFTTGNFRQLPPKLAKHMLRGGIVVISVEKNTPASRSGLKSYDVLVGLDGWEAVDRLGLTSIIPKLSGKPSFKLLVLRKDEIVHLELERPVATPVEKK